ncbi:hypothetical protein ABBQ32_008780 [Trebouxia sp. C0010 RCD-2024]
MNRSGRRLVKPTQGSPVRKLTPQPQTPRDGQPTGQNTSSGAETAARQAPVDVSLIPELDFPDGEDIHRHLIKLSSLQTRLTTVTNNKLHEQNELLAKILAQLSKTSPQALVKKEIRKYLRPAMEMSTYYPQDDLLEAVTMKVTKRRLEDADVPGQQYHYQVKKEATAQARTAVRAPATKEIKTAIVQNYMASPVLPKESAIYDEEGEYLQNNATVLLDGRFYWPGHPPHQRLRMPVSSRTSQLRNWRWLKL